MESKQITIRLPVPLVNILRKISERTGESIQTVILRLLKENLPSGYLKPVEANKPSPDSRNDGP